MDTIIYIYRKRGLQEPAVEPVGLKSYMLIRVGLDVKKDEWFGLALGLSQEEQAGGGAEEKPEAVGAADWEEGSGAVAFRALHPLRSLKLQRIHRRNRRLEERRRRDAQQERERLLAERKERIRQADMAVERLAREILELAQERRNCRCVYEGAVRKALIDPLKDPQVLPELWSRHFSMEEFQDYTQRFWTDRLLPYARLCHYVILGTAPCIYEIIVERARRMKSLRWMLLEADCNQELQDFAEDFYTEYGLAIELRTFGSAEEFRRQRPLCSQPSNIIDFTGDVCPSVTEAAEGSVWLDMLSSEEKRYRLQGRRTGVEYVSLKEEWKRAKRRCNPPERHHFWGRQMP